jgi:hypothetical protein
VMTQGCEHLTATELESWLATALPRDRVIYATGFLCVACRDADVRKDPNAPKLWALQGAAWRAYERGKVHLVQKRLGPKRFDYLAVCAAR